MPQYKDAQIAAHAHGLKDGQLATNVKNKDWSMKIISSVNLSA